MLSRLSNDVNGVEDVVTDTAFGFVRNAMVTIATLVLMLALTLLTLVLIPLVGWPMQRAGTASYRARTRTQAKLAEMFGYLQEVLGISGMQLVEAFGTRRRESARFAGHNDEVRRLRIRQEMIGRWFGMFTNTLEVAAPALMILFGGWLVINDHATVGIVSCSRRCSAPSSPEGSERWPASMSTWSARWRCSAGCSSTSTECRTSSTDPASSTA